MNLLLDSCTLIWLASEPGNLSAPAIEAINDSAAVLHVSHASLWEVTLKHSSGKLALPDPPRHWWTEQVRRWALVELHLSAEILFRASELPPFHKDPFDRVILAHAGAGNLRVVSPDRFFPTYGISVLW